MERTMLEKRQCPTLKRISDRVVTCMEYAECQAESGQVVPVARLVLPATLRGVPSFFEPNFGLRRWVTFGSQRANRVTSLGLSEWYMCPVMRWLAINS